MYVGTFGYLLEHFSRVWNTTPIARNDVNSSGQMLQLSQRSLDAAGGLGLVLHHLNSTMASYSLQQIFGITPAVCSRYLRFGMQILVTTLESLPDSRISWPSEKTMQKFAQLICNRHPLLLSAFGFVDGIHFPVARSQDMDIENAYYNGWCSDHFTSNLFAFGPDGTIFHALVNAPGSWHDVQISRRLYAHLIDDTPSPYYVVGDTAFTTTRIDLAGKIRTPPKADFLAYSSDPHTALAEVRFNEELVSARQAAEWGMQCLQGCFSRLKVPMPADDAKYREMLIKLYVRLHNMRANLVGINQICTVYEGIWTEGRVGSTAYHDFKDLLFRDIRKNDRIRCFYNFLP